METEEAEAEETMGTKEGGRDDGEMEEGDPLLRPNRESRGWNIAGINRAMTEIRKAVVLMGWEITIRGSRAGLKALASVAGICMILIATYNMTLIVAPLWD